MLCKHLGLTATKKSCIDDDNVLAPADNATSIDHRSLHIHAALALGDQRSGPASRTQRVWFGFGFGISGFVFLGRV